MGKSCINFQSVDELPLPTIAAILAEAPKVVVEGGTMSAGGFAKAEARSKAAAAKKKKKKKARSRS